MLEQDDAFIPTMILLMVFVSICILEFETRREPYYWILWALDMFRPKVYEMSRLNLEYTVLSKQRPIMTTVALVFFPCCLIRHCSDEI